MPPAFFFFDFTLFLLLMIFDAIITPPYAYAAFLSYFDAITLSPCRYAAIARHAPLIFFAAFSPLRYAFHFHFSPLRRLLRLLRCFDNVKYHATTATSRRQRYWCFARRLRHDIFAAATLRHAMLHAADITLIHDMPFRCRRHITLFRLMLTLFSPLRWWYAAADWVTLFAMMFSLLFHVAAATPLWPDTYQRVTGGYDMALLIAARALTAHDNVTPSVHHFCCRRYPHADAYLNTLLLFFHERRCHRFSLKSTILLRHAWFFADAIIFDGWWYGDIALSLYARFSLSPPLLSLTPLFRAALFFAIFSMFHWYRQQRHYFHFRYYWCLILRRLRHYAA